MNKQNKTAGKTAKKPLRACILEAIKKYSSANPMEKDFAILADNAFAGDGAAGVFAQAAAMDRRDDLAKLRASCDRLHNGYCTPCKFDCPLYTNGKCKDPMKEEISNA